MRVTNRVLARRRATTTLVSLPAFAAALAIAACGSSSPGNSSQSTSKAPSNNSAATVSTMKVAGYGTVLSTGKATPLYMLTADPKGGSSCTGSCAAAWPPLMVKGKPTAGTGVDASLLSTFKRRDGTTQVSYNGQALYTHPGLSASASAGTASDGGVWYLVAPSGKPVKKTTGGGY